ncbi:MAG: WD40 repeat domain-containing protein, partial [Ktedonobacteraceae bacterium]
ASAGDEMIVRIWQIATEQTVAFCIGHQQAVRSLSWSPDSCFLASASSDGTVRIWEASTAARCLLTYPEHTGDITTITWSPDSHCLASASLDGTVHIWQPHL